MNSTKSRRFAFTSWDKPTFRPNCKLIYLIFQSEWTSEGKLHYQGYVETMNFYSLQQIKSIMKSKTVHVEHATASRSLNTMYCTKVKTFAGFRHMIDYLTDETFTIDMPPFDFTELPDKDPHEDSIDKWITEYQDQLNTPFDKH